MPKDGSAYETTLEEKVKLKQERLSARYFLAILLAAILMVTNLQIKAFAEESDGIEEVSAVEATDEPAQADDRPHAAYPITINSDPGKTTNCSIEAWPEAAEPGDRVDLTVRLQACAKLAKLTVTGDTTGKSYDTSLDRGSSRSYVKHYRFTMPEEPVTVTAVFGFGPYELHAADDITGTTIFYVNDQEVTEADYGDKVTVVCTTPDATQSIAKMRYSYTEDGLYRDPVMEGSCTRGENGFVYTGTFEMRAADVTVEAQYQPAFAINADKGLEGIHISTNMKGNRAVPGDTVRIEALKLGLLSSEGILFPDDWDLTWTDAKGTQQRIDVTRDEKNPSKCSFTMPDGDVNVNLQGLKYAWAVDVAKTSCGAKADARYALPGTTVTVTMEGGSKQQLVVTSTKDGETQQVDITKTGGSTYTFVMPDAPVKVREARGVAYVKRAWNGSKITETTCYENDAQRLADLDQKTGWTLKGSWYIADTKLTFDKRITIAKDVNLILADGCTLNANGGIHIQAGCTLTIYGQKGGTGSLVCKGKGGAGIGGNTKTMGGNLVIHGGTIEATAETNAAGIGGGNHEGSGMGDVTIYGGTVSAFGGSSGAGIGRGQHNNSFGRVAIYGGNVTASGGNYAAGIGGGEDRCGFDVTICGGTVAAKGGESGAGIGGGEGGSQGGTIQIDGGDVKAHGGVNGAGIGGGCYCRGGADGGTVIINGGKVEALGSSFAASIGGGGRDAGMKAGANGDITINGGEVNCALTYARNRGAGIGSGSGRSQGGTITINGGIVQARSTGGAGIGGGEGGGHASKIVITDGLVTAESKTGAGIGGGDGGNGGTIDISGGIVVAASTQKGAGIGGGNDGDGAHLTVSGGHVTAMGGQYSFNWWPKPNYTGHFKQMAKILRPQKANYSIIALFVANLIFSGDYAGAGIGGGDDRSGGSFTFTGGTVITNTRKNTASAIGYGDGGAKKAAGGFSISDKAIVRYGKWLDGEPQITGSVSGADQKLCAQKCQASTYAELHMGYKLSFDAGKGGSGAMDDACVYDNEAYKLPECGFTAPAGQRFKCWLVNGVETKAGEEYRAGGDATATAIWEPNGTTPLFRDENPVLPGKIGIDFSMELPELEGVDYTKSYMTFSISGKGAITERCNYDAQRKDPSGAYHTFTCYVSPTQMAETITATFHYNDGTDKTVEKTTSVQECLLACERKSDQLDDATNGLCMALADYGHYLQRYFSEARGWTLGEDCAEMTLFYTNSFIVKDAKKALADHSSNVTKGSKDIKKATISLRLDSDVTLCTYFTPVPGYDGAFEVTVDGKSVTPTRLKDGRYLVEIAGIGADKLDERHSIVATTATGAHTIECSVLSYTQDMLNDHPKDPTVLNAASAIWRYAEAAKAYSEAH